MQIPLSGRHRFPLIQLPTRVRKRNIVLKYNNNTTIVIGPLQSVIQHIV